MPDTPEGQTPAPTPETAPPVEKRPPLAARSMTEVTQLLSEGKLKHTNIDAARSEDSPERATKEQLWAQKAAEIDHVADRLGHPIDTGIKDTVIATNLLGIDTTGSCEGHLEFGDGPYLDVSANDDETDRLEERRIQLFRQIHISPEFNSLPQEEKDPILKEYDELRQAVTQRNLEHTQKMIGYLNEFYRTRASIPGIRLISEPKGTLGSSRINSEAVEFQADLDPQTKQQKLGEFQTEMRDFTEFLKAKFFGEESLKIAA